MPAEGLKIWRGHFIFNRRFFSISSKFLFFWEGAGVGGVNCPPRACQGPPALNFTLGLLAKEDDGDTVISLVSNLHLEKIKHNWVKFFMKSQVFSRDF